MKPWALALIGALSAAACAPMPTVDDGFSSAQRRARLEALSDWEIDGRLAIDTGEHAFQGRFRWHETGDRLLLAVRGFLGAGSMRVEGTLDDLRVTARGETLELTDAESQLSALVGWWLPVGSLNAWLRGLPDGAYPARTSLGRYGTLASLEQRRWRVDFGNYALRSDVLLPTEIAMAYGRLQIKLTLDTFTSGPGSVTGGGLN